MSACRMRDAAIVTIGCGHRLPVTAVTVACIHEHVTAGLPVCANCLERHAADPLCCAACELQAPRGMRHCCPVTVQAEVMP